MEEVEKRKRHWHRQNGMCQTNGFVLLHKDHSLKFKIILTCHNRSELNDFSSMSRMWKKRRGRVRVEGGGGTGT
jgi:hypothetical protein